LFAGFFLPGDSLLFLAGIYSELLTRQISLGNDFINVVLLSSLVSLAGVFGNMVGYWFGVKGGSYLYNKKDTFWFKEKYLLQSRDFFDKYGGKAIIFARFLPIFRTFAPIVAGIAAMDKKKFMFNNIVGSTLWSFSMIFAGHYLSALFMEKFKIDLKSHIEYIVIGIVFVTTAPVLWKLLKKRVH
jgi:membrane-associated protein